MAVIGLAVGTVATVKLTELAPAGIVTAAGTPTFFSLDVSATTWPPFGAGELIWTVPTGFTPPVTVAGSTVRRTFAGDNETRQETEAPFAVAVTDAALTVEMRPAVAMNVAEVAFAGIVIC